MLLSKHLLHFYTFQRKTGGGGSGRAMLFLKKKKLYMICNDHANYDTIKYVKKKQQLRNDPVGCIAVSHV